MQLNRDEHLAGESGPSNFYNRVCARVTPATQSCNNISEDLENEISALAARNRSNPAQAKADAAAHRAVRTRCPFLQNALHPSHPKPQTPNPKLQIRRRHRSHKR